MASHEGGSSSNKNQSLSGAESLDAWAVYTTTGQQSITYQPLSREAPGHADSATGGWAVPVPSTATEAAAP